MYAKVTVVSEGKRYHSLSGHILLKLASQWSGSLPGFEMDGLGGAGLDTGAAGEAIRNRDLLLFQDGVHHGGGTGLGAGFAGDAGIVIDIDFKPAQLFGDPTYQPEGTEQMTPGPIDENGGQRKGSGEDKPDRAEPGWVENLEWIEGFHEIRFPGKRPPNDGNKKEDPHRVGDSEGRFELPQQALPVLGITIETKQEILQCTELAAPGTDELIGEKYRE
jgi:hypothetical protein